MYTRIVPFANCSDRNINEDLGKPEVSTKRGSGINMT
jgi:hypothetical protein